MNNQPVNKIKIHPNGKMNPHRKSFRKIVRKFNKTQFNEVVGELCVIMSEFYADSDSEGFADLSASDSEPEPEPEPEDDELVEPEPNYDPEELVCLECDDADQKIPEINQNTQEIRRHPKSDLALCEARVWDNHTHNAYCSRVAQHKINGVKVCNRHAQAHSCQSQNRTLKDGTTTRVCKCWAFNGFAKIDPETKTLKCPCKYQYEYLGHIGEDDFPQWYKGMKFQDEKHNYAKRKPKGPTKPKKYAEGECIICKDSFDDLKLFKRQVHTYKCRDSPVPHSVCKPCYKEYCRVNPDKKNQCPYNCEQH